MARKEPTMATVHESPVDTIKDLLKSLGNVPAERVRLKPPPGTATEADVLAAWSGPRRRLCELVDGVLVEKAMGIHESFVALYLAHLLWDYLENHDLGILLGSDGMLRLFPGRVRIPDVSFISWDALPKGKLPKAAIAPFGPDLAVEVLSKSNTKGEIRRKIKEYFLSGTKRVWVIQPRTQTAEVYSSPGKKKLLSASDALDGEDLLPGFQVRLKDLFDRAERQIKKRGNNS
jgi:Uma2 family endonuclease